MNLARKLHNKLVDLQVLQFFNVKEEEITMKWETPEYSDIRFGFEVTMYINNK